MDLTQWTWLIWLILVFAFVVIEIFTLEFTFAMLAAGALLGGLGTTLLGGQWWLQILVAAVLSALLLFLIRPLLLRTLRKSEDTTPHNIDAVPGLIGRATAAFVDGRGEVKLDNGETWTARLADGDRSTVSAGARILVRRVLGATVEVALDGAGKES